MFEKVRKSIVLTLREGGLNYVLYILQLLQFHNSRVVNV